MAITNILLYDASKAKQDKIDAERKKTMVQFYLKLRSPYDKEKIIQKLDQQYEQSKSK